MRNIYSTYRTSVLAVLAALTLLHPSSPAQQTVPRQLHLVGQQQSITPNQGASVTEYMARKGEIYPVQVLLQLPQNWQNRYLFATDKVGDYFFSTYPEIVNTTVQIYNWRSGQLYTPTVFNQEQLGSATVLRNYSTNTDGQVCANWPLFSVPVSWNASGLISRGVIELYSICIAPNQTPQVMVGNWSLAANPVWPGSDIAGNEDSTVFLHLNGRSLVLDTESLHSVVFGTVPSPLADEAKNNGVAVLAANDRFMLLRASSQSESATVYVQNRRNYTWQTLDSSTRKIQYRIFGSTVVALQEDCDANDVGGDLHARCIPSALTLEDLENHTIYLLPHTVDSEVIDIEPDQAIVFREGDALYTFALGTPVDRTRDFIARGKQVTNVHWAFYR